MVQRGFHFRHLRGGRLVLAVHICKVLQPECPCLAGQSSFCLSSNLMGSLDQDCSSPSFTWSVHIIWMPGITYGATHRTQMTLMAHPVLGIFYWLPWFLLPRESWFRVGPRHSTPWLDWFPYRIEIWRSTSEISKRNVLGYNPNLGSLRYGNEYCVPGRAMSCRPRMLPSKKSDLRWQSSWLYSQAPLLIWRAMAGCIAIGSRATVVHWLVFLILHEPIDVQL